MKKCLLGCVVALALLFASAGSAKADGGFGFSTGLRLSGDMSWYGWRGCNNCGGGGGAPAGPSVWPMGGPGMMPMGGPPMMPMGWGYPMPAPMPFPIHGGFGMGAPMYSAPMPMHFGW